MPADQSGVDTDQKAGGDVITFTKIFLQQHAEQLYFKAPHSGWMACKKGYPHSMAFQFVCETCNVGGSLLGLSRLFGDTN
jgi:hypothetical protein